MYFMLSVTQEKSQKYNLLQKFNYLLKFRAVNTNYTQNLKLPVRYKADVKHANEEKK